MVQHNEQSDEVAVRAATVAFYDALEALVIGRGAAAMDAAWHHTDRVTAAHPLGEWSYGWDEVRASWHAVAAVGKPGLGGSEIRDLRVHLYGDVAYTTGVFVATPAFGRLRLNVTNVLHRQDGVWKIVHHHADKAPAIETGLAKAAEDG